MSDSPRFSTGCPCVIHAPCLTPKMLNRTKCAILAKGPRLCPPSGQLILLWGLIEAEVLQAATLIVVPVVEGLVCICRCVEGGRARASNHTTPHRRPPVAGETLVVLGYVRDSGPRTRGSTMLREIVSMRQEHLVSPRTIELVVHGTNLLARYSRGRYDCVHPFSLVLTRL